MKVAEQDETITTLQGYIKASLPGVPAQSGVPGERQEDNTSIERTYTADWTKDPAAITTLAASLGCDLPLMPAATGAATSRQASLPGGSQRRTPTPPAPKGGRVPPPPPPGAPRWGRAKGPPAGRGGTLQSGHVGWLALGVHCGSPKNGLEA